MGEGGGGSVWRAVIDAGMLDALLGGRIALSPQQSNLPCFRAPLTRRWVNLPQMSQTASPRYTVSSIGVEREGGGGVRLRGKEGGGGGGGAEEL